MPRYAPVLRGVSCWDRSSGILSTSDIGKRTTLFRLPGKTKLRSARWPFTSIADATTNLILRWARRRSTNCFRKSTSTTNSISIPATTARHISASTWARSWNFIPKCLGLRSDLEAFDNGDWASPPAGRARRPSSTDLSIAIFCIFLIGLDGSGHRILKRRLALLLEFRMRQRLARQHLIAHRSVINKDRFNRGCLRQISWLQPFVGIHVRVMRPRTIVELILNKLEARNAYGVERLVIGALGIAHTNRGHPQIL